MDEAYLIIYSHHYCEISLRITLRATCYNVSAPRLSAKPPQYSSIDQALNSRELEFSTMGTAAIIVSNRARMANDLIRKAPEYGTQDCILMPRKEFNELHEQLEKQKGYARTWKQRAKSYFRALSFLGSK